MMIEQIAHDLLAVFLASEPKNEPGRAHWLSAEEPVLPGVVEKLKRKALDAMPALAGSYPQDDAGEPLARPPGAVSAALAEKDGCQLRVVAVYDVHSDTSRLRVDVRRA